MTPPANQGVRRSARTIRGCERNCDFDFVIYLLTRYVLCLPEGANETVILISSSTC